MKKNRRKIEKIETAFDARCEKRLKDAFSEAAAEAAEAEKDRVASLLVQHPAIGVLCRGGRPAYYVGGADDVVYSNIDDAVRAAEGKQ